VGVRDPHAHNNNNDDNNDNDDRDTDDYSGEGNWREDTWREDPYTADDVTELLGRAARLDAVCRAEDSGEDIDPYDGGWA
jgi:hypothetical protein